MTTQPDPEELEDPSGEDLRRQRLSGSRRAPVPRGQLRGTRADDCTPLDAAPCVTDPQCRLSGRVLGT